MNRPQKHARKHHYVPQFYLAGFTPSGKRDDQLWVFDKETGTSWESNSAGVAFEKDLYRIEDPGVEPDLLEKEFSELEGRAAAAVTEVKKTKQIPDGEGFSDLLHFVALMAVRVPQKRRNIAKPMEQVAKQFLQMVVQTPDRWQATMAQMRDAGMNVDDKTSYEAMKDFVERDQRVAMHQNWHLGIMLHMAATILDLLPLRRWSLIASDEKSGEFICTDNPVLLTWTEKMPPLSSPGFGVGSTEIKMPLTRQLALVARFEGTAMVSSATPTDVAAINRQAAILADRFVYSGTKDFPCILNGQIASGPDFLARLRTENDQPKR